MHWVNIQLPAQRISRPAPTPHQVKPNLSPPRRCGYTRNSRGLNRIAQGEEKRLTTAFAIQPSIVQGIVSSKSVVCYSYLYRLEALRRAQAKDANLGQTTVTGKHPAITVFTQIITLLILLVSTKLQYSWSVAYVVCHRNFLLKGAIFFRSPLGSGPALPVSGCLGRWVKGGAKNSILWFRKWRTYPKEGNEPDESEWNACPRISWR